MQLSSVILARVIAYIETFDLSPRGKAFYPELVTEIVKKYNFQKFPTNFEHLDESKGVEFLEGKVGSTVVQKFVIWDSLLTLDTRSDTKDSQRILEEMLSWGAERFGLNYKPGMIKRFGFVSDVTFFSDAPLLVVGTPVATLASDASAAVSAVWHEPIVYEPMILTIGHDPLSRKYALPPFTIQRRAEAPFSDNKYFSEAPLPTEIHLKLLAQYEKDVLAKSTSSKP